MWYRLAASAAVIFAAVFLCFIQPAFSSKQKQPISDGKLYLSAADFYGGKCVSLDGKWDFYWHKLLNESDLKKARPDFEGLVPRNWNLYRRNGKYLPAQGYATYRLRVTTDIKKGEIMGLCLNTFSSAYRLFVSDRLVASNGVVGKSAAASRGEYRPLKACFAVPSGSFDIIVQVSNYQFDSGGFWYSAYIGGEAAANGLFDKRGLIETFVLGMLAFILLGYTLTYFRIRNMESQKYMLTFLPLVMMLMLVIDTSEQMFLHHLIPGINFRFYIAITYISQYWAVALLTIFTWQVYPIFKSKWPVRVIIAANSVIALLLLFVPTIHYNVFSVPTYSFLYAEFLFSVFLPIVGIKRRQKNAILYFTCESIYLICYLYEMMNDNNMITGGVLNVMLIGSCTLVFMQCFVQSQNISETYAKNVELLGNQIKLLSELKISADREKATELKFLQSQIRPHFIFNALNTISSILLYDTGYARKLLVEFSKYLRNCFDFKNLDEKIPLDQELEHVRSYLSLEHARFGDRLKINYELELEKIQNYKIPPLILQPLVENAVIHGIRQKPEGGTVTLSAMEADGCLVLCVVDDGVGISPERLRQIEEDNLERGVGLCNINLRLQKLYNCSLSIISDEGVGTRVTIKLPVTE